MRLFVALDIPDDARNALSALAGKLRDVCPDARWVRIAGAHVTLKFIGESSPARAEQIRSALGHVTASSPIKMRFAGVGFFPNARRPRVLWAGVHAGDAVRALAKSIEDKLEPLDIARETREFSPHITLARLDSPENLEPLRAAVEKLGSPEFGHTRATEFRLYQSVLKPGGAEYTRIASYHFPREQAS